jgi:hypothetical protein
MVAKDANRSLAVPIRLQTS